MIEKKIFIDTEMPVDMLGAQNENLKLIQKLFPKLVISHRGDEITLKGDESEINNFLAFYESLTQHLRKYKLLRPEDINNIFYERLPSSNISDVVTYGNHGKIIRPRTKGQERLIEAFGKDDLLFAIGPAGTGKTYMAISLAVKALKERQVQRIILSRPAVEAGESLGFLPGDVKMKLDPYLQALYDALHDLIPGRKLNTLIENGTVQIAPLAYMRGRTLNNAVVILDEAQNTTLGQIKMFLTRMGENSKFFVTGDVTQIDLPVKSASGLVKAKQLLGKIKGISFIEFSKDEIIRHRLVTSIVNAFEKDETT
jgi:phosphate starvation-inducible PhoH-like protein